MLRQELLAFKSSFDKKLLDYLQRKRRQGIKITPEYKNLIDEILRFISVGGKRLRPAFCVWAYRACRGQDDKTVWPAAFALELAHAFALIHDDIMDKSDYRRGELTTWKKLGINQAILIGDLAFHLAEECFSQVKNKEAISYWHLLKREVIAGQYLDISKTLREWPNGLSRSEHLILKILDLKSGRYTVARPLQIGASLAGADEKTLKGLFEYGVNLGLAFQIKDDILGVFGKSELTGKPVGDDISEGKKTLLVAWMLDAYRLQLAANSKQELKHFLNLFGKRKKLNQKELSQIQKMMIKSQAFKKCEQKMFDLAQRAKTAIVNLDLRSKEKQSLLEITDFITERKY